MDVRPDPAFFQVAQAVAVRILLRVVHAGESVRAEGRPVQAHVVDPAFPEFCAEAVVLPVADGEEPVCRGRETSGRFSRQNAFEIEPHLRAVVFQRRPDPSARKRIRVHEPAVRPQHGVGTVFVEAEAIAVPGPGLVVGNRFGPGRSAVRVQPYLCAHGEGASGQQRRILRDPHPVVQAVEPQRPAHISVFRPAPVRIRKPHQFPMVGVLGGIDGVAARAVVQLPPADQRGIET